MQAGRLALQLEDVDLAEVAKNAVEALAEDLHIAGCAVSQRTTPVVGRWDRSPLEQVVTNLLANALKFGAGKPIEVVVDRTDGIGRLTVIDHGIGIPPDRLPHVFERFERAVSARRYGGLGLGLYIVRSVVSALGGSVRAASAGTGTGATLVVELPCIGPPS
ncbi:MAG: HAMP domain-containing histidine kinase [Deltaproteobacteria bacterium]|nr:HAMP domain-containing histidine kinase [Deltaproteobacteria bacterium]